MQVLAFVILLWIQPVPDGIAESFQHFDTEDGLSNNIVYSTYQDRDGFIWVATENGLNRFDGYEFKKFYHSAEDSTSLSSNIVRSFVEDEQGNLWIGTFNGLNLYDRKTESFIRYFDLPDSSGNRLDLKQMQLSGDGTIWFNTLDSFGKFDVEKREFRFINLEVSPFSISVSNDNQIFVQSKKGELFEYVTETQTLTLIYSHERYSETPIYWGEYSNRLWSKGSLELQGTRIQGSEIPDLPDKISPKILLETNTDQLLIASDHGLFSYSKQSERLKRINFDEKSSSLTNSIRSLYKDRNGGVWVGTLNGLFYFDPYQKPFGHIDVMEGATDIVMGMAQMNDEILINSFSRKLLAHSQNNKTIREIRAEIPPVNDFFQIWDIEIVEESQHPVWLATNAGLFLYNPENESLKHIQLNVADETFPASFSIFKGEEFIWVSSVFAVYQLNKNSGKIIQVVKSYDHPPGSIIQDIQKSEDIFYVATEGDGIFSFEEGDSQMLPLDNFIESASQLQTVPVWDIFDGKERLLWVGTNRGLFKLDEEKNELDFISRGTILENTVIFSIQQDDKLNLWLGTEKGIMEFNPATNEVSSYSKNDGILNIEFNRKSSIRSVDGNFWFGGIEGITVFDPDQIRRNTIVPPVHITDVQVITTDSVFTPEGVFERVLNLPWNQNTLEVQFTALNYTNSSQNKYKYKLEGYDPAWVEAGIGREARYVQLPHGRYSFKVLASNNDGIWNMQGTSLQINISPPFWKTWWFKVIVFLLLVLLLWGLYRYRVKQLLEIERVKLRIAGDLHDEIGSGLSGIALTGDILLKQLNNGGARPEMVERITLSSRSLASSLDAIVWLIDPKKETLGDLISKCQVTVQELLSNKRVRVENHMSTKDERVVLTSTNRRHLFLFFKEAVHNIAKHSGATKVEIRFWKEMGNFGIEIRDNGKGFDLKEAPAGRGIGTMNERAKELRSELSINSMVGEGTELKLKIKIP